MKRLRGYQGYRGYNEQQGWTWFFLNLLIPGYEVTGFRRLHGYGIAKSSIYLAISNFYHSHSFTSHFQFSFNFHCPLRFYLDKNIKSHFENVPSTLLFHLKPMTPDQHIIVSLDCCSCFQYFQNFSAYLCFYLWLGIPSLFLDFSYFPFYSLFQKSAREYPTEWVMLCRESG